MNSPEQLKILVKERIDRLPNDALQEVADLVDTLLNETYSAEKPAGVTMPQGTVADLLACAGTWKFDPGELEEILRDIELSRLMELEEDDVVLD